MRTKYIQHYVDGAHLRLSLDALWHHVAWPPDINCALTMTQWGPFYLTGNNAPFVPIFIRTADRALHHAGNVWRQLSKNLSSYSALRTLPLGAVMQTYDRTSKYEIEAFLGAVVGITEENLIGDIKRNRLGRSEGLGPDLITKVRQTAQAFIQIGGRKKWRSLRNSVYHLNPNLHDWGFSSNIVLRGDQYAVELSGMYYEDGLSPDLISVFTEIFEAFVSFVRTIRDLLLEFSFKHICIPTNNHYYKAVDELGNMWVCLGPSGYEFKHFPETAADFIGPPGR